MSYDAMGGRRTRKAGKLRKARGGKDETDNGSEENGSEENKFRSKIYDIPKCVQYFSRIFFSLPFPIRWFPLGDGKPLCVPIKAWAEPIWAGTGKNTRPFSHSSDLSDANRSEQPEKSINTRKFQNRLRKHYHFFFFFRFPFFCSAGVSSLDPVKPVPLAICTSMDGRAIRDKEQKVYKGAEIPIEIMRAFFSFDRVVLSFCHLRRLIRLFPYL